MNNKIWLACIVALGFLARVVFLTQFPAGFTADEASQAYDAYSILKTGKDGWGEFMPLFPRSLGDYKSPLYMYLSIPSVAIFGLNAFAARLPAVILGTLTIVVLFFLARSFFESKVALFSALLLAISPWHIQLSRASFEGGAGIFFFSLSILVLLYGLKNHPRLVPFSFLLLGVTSYTYHSWRFLVILFFPFLLLFLKSSKIKSRFITLSIVIFGLTFLPTILNLKLVLTRASDVSIFSPKNINSFFVNKGTSPVNPVLNKLIDNKYKYVLSQFTNNYLSYFSPYFYFSTARPDTTYLNFPQTPLHYQVEIIFMGIGIYYLIKKRNPYSMLLLIWAVLAPISPALTESFNANRAVTLLPLTVIVSGYGMAQVYEKLSKSRFSHANLILSSVLGIFFCLFLIDYFFRLPYYPIHNQRVGYTEAFNKAISLESQYDSIHFSKFYTNPQIFVAFYKVWDPVDFQKNSQDWLRYEKAGLKYVDQLESYNLGKYEIHDIDWSRDKNRQGQLLFVSNEINFPQGVFSVWDYVDPQGNKIFRFIPVPQNEI